MSVLCAFDNEKSYCIYVVFDVCENKERMCICMCLGV